MFLYLKKDVILSQSFIMKLFFYLSILLVIPFFSNSQVYQAKIDSLNTEINKSVDIQDFELAAEQKMKRDLYVELEEAVKNNDFDRAHQLKEQINADPAKKKTTTPSDNYSSNSDNNENALFRYRNNDLRIRVGVDFPARPNVTESNSAFVKQRVAIAVKNEMAYQLVIQQSMPVNLARTLEKELNGTISNKRSYIVNRRKVIEFDIEYQGNYAKIKAVNRKKGVTWVQVSSKTHLPTTNEVESFFNSFTINEIELIEKAK